MPRLHRILICLLCGLCLLPLALLSALPARMHGAQVTHRKAKNAVQKVKHAQVAGIASGPPTTFDQPFVPRNHKLFMLHWQTSCLGYGTVPWQTVGSAEGYAVAINEAKRAGADGFGLDLGGNDASYLASVANLYAAANQVNAAAGWVNGQTGTTNAQGVGKFSVYIKFDFSNTSLENTQTIVSVLSPLLRNPANWVWQGRPVYANYVGGGGRSWASLRAIFAPANTQLTVNGVKPFVIWGGEPTHADGSGCDYSRATLKAWAAGCVRPIADAVWQFPSTQTAVGTKSGIPATETLANAVHAAGLQYQASVIPSYGQTANKAVRFLENFCGGEGIGAEWKSINTVQKPELGAEMATANDLGELSNILAGGPYMAGGMSPDPAKEVWIGYPKSGIPGFYPSKLGLQADNLFWVQGMKTGVRPAITRDRLCAYYCRQTGAALQSPAADPLGPIYAEDNDTGGSNPKSTPDRVYLTCYLAAPATVKLIQSSGAAVSRPVPAGQSFIRLPLAPGSVKVELMRGSVPRISMVGDPVSGAAFVSDAAVFSMTAHD